MFEQSTDKQAIQIVDRLQLAFAALLEAIDYATDTGSDPWDFAVPIRSLRKHKLTEADLRWCVRKGYVQHAREVTVRGDDGRAFRPTGNLTFARRTCFVLTAEGVAIARSCSAVQTTTADASAEHPASEGQSAKSVVLWDAEARKLRVNGQLVKRFKWPAANQEAILNAFQEEGWPARIDDPLPPHSDQDPKRRLSDTIKCLNRKHSKHLLQFRGDGTGEGVLWELVKPDSAGNGAE